MLEPVLCGLLSQAPLLPKLRGHFAEFLDNASSVGLRILSSSTCVGLRYGCFMNDSGFSRRMAFALPYYFSVVSRRPLSPAGFPTGQDSAFHGIPFPLAPPIRVPTVLSQSSTGISTCYPSATTFVLTLGPDFPREDQLYSGNLGYSAWRIRTSISLLIPAFSLPAPPRPLTVPLR